MGDPEARRDAAGLCGHCAFCRIVKGERSVFYLCERSFTDRRYGKYPVLPVVSCGGYERLEPSGRSDDKLTG